MTATVTAGVRVVWCSAIDDWSGRPVILAKTRDDTHPRCRWQLLRRDRAGNWWPITPPLDDFHASEWWAYAGGAHGALPLDVGAEVERQVHDLLH